MSCTVDFIASKLFPEEDTAGFPHLHPHENQLQDKETIPNNQDHNNKRVISPVKPD